MTSAHPSQNCCVWDSYKYALYTKFREPKLYRYAAQGDWDLIPQRCKTHPKEATFVHKYAPMDTPLNRLLRTESCTGCSVELKVSIFDMKHQAVEALLNVHPASAAQRDSFLRTPLHWACMDSKGNNGDSEDSSYNVALMLMERAPQAVQMKDIEQRTPLHYLVARNDPVPVKLLTKMVALYPEALSMKDEVGETPVDIIRSRKDELDNVDDLILTLKKLQSMLSESTKDVLENV